MNNIEEPGQVKADTPPNFVTRNSLTIFFVLSYLIMILCVATIVYVFPPISGEVTGVGRVFLYTSIFSPTISAIIVAGMIGGWLEIKKVLSGFLIWRVGFFWYFAGFFLFLGPFIVALFYNLLGGEAPGNYGWTFSLFLVTMLNTLIKGPLTEEAGWRGFALPRLEARFNALVSSLILGVIWACWHIPLYFIEPRTPFFIYIVLVVVITILMTWAYNNTRGSLIIAVIFHFSFNLVSVVLTGTEGGSLGLLPVNVFYIVGGVMIGVYVILVVAFSGPAKLSRKPDSEMPFVRAK